VKNIQNTSFCVCFSRLLLMGKILAYKFGTTGGRVNDDVFLKKSYIYMNPFFFPDRGEDTCNPGHG